MKEPQLKYCQNIQICLIIQSLIQRSIIFLTSFSEVIDFADDISIKDLLEVKHLFVTKDKG